MSETRVSSNGDLQVQIALTEYQKLRDELLQHIHYHQQLPVLALGASAALIPLLLTQLLSWPSYAIAGVLHGIAVAFSVIVMQYSSALFSMHQIASYVRDHIEPLVNQWANSDRQVKDLLYWETAVKYRRGNWIFAGLESAGATGTVILMLLPGIATLVLAKFVVVAQPSVVPSQELVIALGVLMVIAWVSYFFSIATLLGVAIYSVTKTAGSMRQRDGKPTTIQESSES